MSELNFSIVRDISRRELERQQKRFIGVTINAPVFKDVSGNGQLEFVCDVRVGVQDGWAAVRNVLIAQWAEGVITDMNIPVLCERSEAGRVTIIARSLIRLPDIVYSAYTLEALGLDFMRVVDYQNGQWVDGFGHSADAPVSEEQRMEYSLSSSAPEWGSPDFIYGVTNIDDRSYAWVEK